MEEGKKGGGVSLERKEEEKVGEEVLVVSRKGVV